MSFFPGKTFLFTNKHGVTMFKNVDLSNICVLPDSTLDVAIE